MDLSNQLLSLENSCLVNGNWIYLIDADYRMTSSMRPDTCSSSNAGNVFLTSHLVILLSVHNCLSLCLGSLVGETTDLIHQCCIILSILRRLNNLGSNSSKGTTANESCSSRRKLANASCYSLGMM